MLAYYSSEIPVPAVRRKKQRNNHPDTQSTSNLPQAETPPTRRSAKHLSLLNLSVSSQDGEGSEAASPTSPSLSVLVSPGSDSVSSVGSPPQRPPLPAGYGSLGRQPKPNLHLCGSNTSKTVESPVAPQSKSPSTEPPYYSLDRGSKPKRPAFHRQLSPLKRAAPSPPVIYPPEVNNNTLSERPMSSDELKNRVLQLLMMDPQ